MAGPAIAVDLNKIERNTRAIISLCQDHHIEVTGVTKVTCGMPQVARAMIRGGISGIGESRIENVYRLRASGIHAPIMLLRIPPLSEVDDIVASVDISLNSELAVIQSLSEAASRRNLIHKIILMVDLGDLREGIWPEDLLPLVERVIELPGVHIVGLGTNLTCYGGVIPTRENMAELVHHARTLERVFGLTLRYISGGNSSSLPLLASGEMPAEINHLRIGEAMLLGRETVYRQPWPGTVQDAFLLTAELIELKKKPTVPIGPTSEDAFGERHHFEDLGYRVRGILNVGREDIHVEGLTPVLPEVSVFGASSDHLLVDVTDVTPPVRLGDRLAFHMNYAALLAAMTSEYVEKDLIAGDGIMEQPTRVHIIGKKNLLAVMQQLTLKEKFTSIGYDVSIVETDSVDFSGNPPGASIEESPAFSDITAEVHNALEKQSIPILLGTEYRMSLAGFLGLAESIENFGLIWFDSKIRGMLPTVYSKSESGNSTLWDILGYTHIPGFRKMASHLSPENVVLIGIREASPEEAELIKQSRAHVFTMEDVDGLGIREIMRRSLRIAFSGTQGVYVRYRPEVTDIRGFEETSGGLTYRETHQAMEMIAASGQLLAIDLVGINPDQDSKVLQRSIEFILSCLGKKILGR